MKLDIFQIVTKHFTKKQQQRIQERQMRKMCTDYRQNEDLRLVALELNTSNTLKTIAFWGVNVFNVFKCFELN